MVGRRRYLLPPNFFGCKYDLIQLYRQIDMAARAFWACFGSTNGQAKSAQQLKMLLLTICTVVYKKVHTIGSVC